jgi:hypothetical protein
VCAIGNVEIAALVGTPDVPRVRMWQTDDAVSMRRSDDMKRRGTADNVVGRPFWSRAFASGARPMRSRDICVGPRRARDHRSSSAGLTPAKAMRQRRRRDRSVFVTDSIIRTNGMPWRF